MEIVIRIEDVLFEEMKQALAVCMQHETPAVAGQLDLSGFASEIIESFLATRRLPFVRLGQQGARIGAETAVDPRPRFAEHRESEPMAPVDIPDLGDLECLSEIS